MTYGNVARARLIVLGSILLVAAVVVLVSYKDQTQFLRVVFFDVGQGDSIFIEAPNGVQMLIDGGNGTQVLRHLGRELGFFDRSLDYVLVTHMDADHVGGLVHVLDRYAVAQVVHTENRAENDLTRAFLSAVADERANTVHARAGQVVDLGDGVMVRVLFPDRDASGLGSNASSIIVQLVYGEHEFLLTGDAPDAIEEYIVSRYDASLLHSDVLKVGHHGSRTSTDERFLATVNPTYGVISAGADNPYGHPHEVVVNRLENAGVIIKNTAEDSSVVFESDGENLWLR